MSETNKHQPGDNGVLRKLIEDGAIPLRASPFNAVAENAALQAKVAELEQERDKDVGHERTMWALAISMVMANSAEISLIGIDDKSEVRKALLPVAEAVERIAQLEAQLGQARATLEPFAEFGRMVDSRESDLRVVARSSVAGYAEVRYADFLSALAALAPEAPKAEEPKPCPVLELACGTCMGSKGYWTANRVWVDCVKCCTKAHQCLT